MAYYQQVKEEQKEAIHREMETRAEGNKKTAASERVNYASGTGLSINKERETPNKIRRGIRVPGVLLGVFACTNGLRVERFPKETLKA